MNDEIKFLQRQIEITIRNTKTSLYIQLASLITLVISISTDVIKGNDINYIAALIILSLLMGMVLIHISIVKHLYNSIKVLISTMDVEE
jgi:hypothetical protein